MESSISTLIGGIVCPGEICIFGLATCAFTVAPPVVAINLNN